MLNVNSNLATYIYLCIDEYIVPKWWHFSGDHCCVIMSSVLWPQTPTQSHQLAPSRDEEKFVDSRIFLIILMSWSVAAPGPVFVGKTDRRRGHHHRYHHQRGSPTLDRYKSSQRTFAEWNCEVSTVPEKENINWWAVSTMRRPSLDTVQCNFARVRWQL